MTHTRMHLWSRGLGCFGQMQPRDQLCLTRCQLPITGPSQEEKRSMSSPPKVDGFGQAAKKSSASKVGRAKKYIGSDRECCPWGGAPFTLPPISTYVLIGVMPYSRSTPALPTNNTFSKCRLTFSESHPVLYTQTAFPRFPWHILSACPLFRLPPPSPFIAYRSAMRVDPTSGAVAPTRSSLRDDLTSEAWCQFHFDGFTPWEASWFNCQ